MGWLFAFCACRADEGPVFVPRARIIENKCVLYRPIQRGDFNKLYAIEQSCFQRPERFSQRYLRQLIKGEQAATWVAVDEQNAPVGFALVAWGAAEQGTLAYIETLEVVAMARRQGAGAGLLRCCIESARSVQAVVLWLHVAEENEAVRKLYLAHDFAVQGREKNFYGRGRDGLVLALWLAQQTPVRAE